MGMFNIRLLLLAAIVLCNCVTWTASRHHYTHNVNGHRSRHRRQGAGLFLPASYIIPGGEGGGAWGEWSEPSPCSRTCGGGVASQKRICLEVGPDGQSLCGGGDTKYFSCQTQDCPERSKDFRAEQCAAYNDKTFKNQKYNWIPYTKAQNPCELNCMPKGERFYYRQQPKVVDGTRCNDESFDVCVNGVCQSVGCDMMLGSKAREDKCRHCRGNNTNCHTIGGILDSQDLRKGYNDILLIPEGATNILIAEVKASNNYLALRAKQDNVYYLNGEYHIDFPRSLMIAGALWHYERSQQGFAAPDRLRCFGPTNEPLYLSLLLQDENVGIDYEYSVPSALAPPPNKEYNWVHDEFTECSETCGGGYQTRKVTCRSREELEVVDETLCDSGLKPIVNQTCNTEACSPQWVTENWGPCSKPCGDGGTMTRRVYCEKIITSGQTLRIPSIVGDKECFELLGPKPELYQECNKNASCPSWFTGPWKPCDKLCGEGKQTRLVVCHQKINGRVKLFNDTVCTEEKPAEKQDCILHPCDGVDWVLTEWTGCDTCLSTMRTRTAQCAMKDHKVVPSELCAYHPAPELEQACDRTKLPACQTLWYATQWGECSAKCGTGTQKRRVFCGLFDGVTVTKVDDDRCDSSSKYNDTKECVVPKEKCPAKWFAGPWSECTKKCDGGMQYRRVMCLSREEKSKECDENDVLDSSQSCNTNPCGIDEMLPVDAKSTSIIDYEEYDDCDDEEEYPEENAEEFTLIPDFILPAKTSTTIKGSGEELTIADIGSGDYSFSTDSTDSTTEVSTETSTEITVTDEYDYDISAEIDEKSISKSTPLSPGTTDESKTTESLTKKTDISSIITKTGSTETEISFTTTSETVSAETVTTESTIFESTVSSISTPSDSSRTATGETITTDSGSTIETGLSTETTVSNLTSITEGDSTKISTVSDVGTDTSSTETYSTTAMESTITTEPTMISSASTDMTVDKSSTSDTTSTESSSSEMSTETSTDFTSLTTESTTVEASTTTTEETITISTEIGSTETTESTETTVSITSSESEVKSTESTTSLETLIPDFYFNTTDAPESTTNDDITSSTTESPKITITPFATSESSYLTTDDIVSESTVSESTVSESTVSESTVSESTVSESTVSKSTESESTVSESTVSESTVSESTVSESTVSESTVSESTVSESTVSESTVSESTVSESTVSESTISESTVSESTISESTISESTTSKTPTGYETETPITESSTYITTTYSEFSTASTETSSGNSISDAATENSTIDISLSTEGDTTPSIETTPWVWTTITRKPSCKGRRKVAKCVRSKFGCCPDKKTPAAGPFDEGCPNPETCKESKYGCCPDGVSPANDPHGADCPVAPCNETLYGCCLSDNVTAAEGNDQLGCPEPVPECKSTIYGCCNDNKTKAKGSKKEGCPEAVTEIETETPGTTKYTQDCANSEFGCCYDNETDAIGPNGEGCPCSITEFGCCPDGVSVAQGPNLEECVMSCNTSAYGCCSDGETPAHGPNQEGCCLLYAFGCCPDNYRPAEGPHLEGCDCKFGRFGCCPDNVTVARGPNFQGCGCQYTDFGCCPDGHTTAQGPEFDGCDCYTYQFGCCPDGVTIANGPNKQDCLCENSKYGCCGDGITAAIGQDKEGCECSNSKYGCCPDGVTEAKGKNFFNCTDMPDNPQASCALTNDRGSCRNFSVYWYYDITYGGCSRFWYGGCDGNDNRFVSEEECKDVCVKPSPKESCQLPKIKGACTGYHIRWYYDSAREQCSQFVYGGCLGNDNNFDTKELCQERCEPQKTEDECNLEIERGSCAGNFLRWGFNRERRRCEQFLWGGCEGNANRFSSEGACKMRCDPPGKSQQACSLPREAGNCTEKHPAWTFSATENRCVPFYYTGCGGNENRFDDELTCTNACPSAYEQEKCTLPAVTGDCAEYSSRWFFDTLNRRCRLFYYGGCGGNENNFVTERECENSCMEQVVITTTPPPAQRTTVTTPRNYDDTGRLEFCYLDIDTGPCTELEQRWAYDAVKAVCTQFEYGGCGGNQNNFPSEEYCTYYCKPTSSLTPELIRTTTEGLDYRFGSGESRTNEDVCQLPMLAGPCDQSLMQWFYDFASDTCSQFTYSGCEGNGNRFNTLEDCERQCRRGSPIAVAVTTPTTTTVAPEYISNECQVSLTLEECREEGVVWYRDVRARQCVAHSNPRAGLACRHTGVFPSEEACERACGAFKDIDVCRYGLDAGPCRESILKVYFNSETGRCESFVYGGCHGGPNRFSTVEECEQICRPVDVDPCNQIPEAGNCQAYLIMWYFDSIRDLCGQFVYTGCNGNDNRFETQEECEGRCKKSSTTTTAFVPTTTPTTTTIAPFTTPRLSVEMECETPRSLEPCGDNVTVYYYDTRTQACLAGDFGACHYSNSYRTEEECERKCGAFRGLDVCGSPLDPGPCLSAIGKVYWEPMSGRCLEFAYGGCRGGPNRFSTVDECQEVCGATGPEPACLHEVSSGDASCGQSARRWYYSATSGDCLAFVYAGCGGNDNNFLSYEECAFLCKRTLAEGGNEVLPDCDRYNEECSSLRCEYAVQRTRTAGGCERCSCVPVDVDCAPLHRECENLHCTYGLNRVNDSNGCPRCNCTDHPCASKECPTTQRCVAMTYRDPLTQNIRYSTECRLVNKAGSCPPESLIPKIAEGQCRQECNDDADCLGVGKCCAHDCSQLCLEPYSASSRMPLHTTRAPELPHAPRANVEDTQPEVVANEGDKATLRCVFHSNPPPKITWQRGAITIEGDTGRYRLLSDGALEIVSLYRNDSGVYICVADNELGSATQEIRLEVADPVDRPAAIAGVPDVTIAGELGKPLSVRCLAFGYPQPSIYWYRGTEMVPYSSTLYEARGHVLLIRQLTLETLGEYLCQAYNGIGKPADWQFTVRAYQPDGTGTHPYLVPKEKEEEVVVVTPRKPVTEVTETTPIATTVPHIEIPVYTVPVRTWLTAERSRVPAGSEINLPCDVDGYPVPAVRWTKDGQPLKADERTTISDARLTVVRANTNDSGVYGCHANNDFSSHYSTVTINVEGLYIPPNCKDNPYFATCYLIVRSKYCHHEYYSKFCCKSCVEAGQLDPNELNMQADTWTWKK